MPLPDKAKLNVQPLRDHRRRDSTDDRDGQNAKVMIHAGACQVSCRPCRAGKGRGVSALICFARHGEVDVVMLVMSHPGASFHEGQILLQVRAARRSE